MGCCYSVWLLSKYTLPGLRVHVIDCRNSTSRNCLCFQATTAVVLAFPDRLVRGLPSESTLGEMICSEIILLTDKPEIDMHVVIVKGQDSLVYSLEQIGIHDSLSLGVVPAAILPLVDILGHALHHVIGVAFDHDVMETSAWIALLVA